jgi:transposase InsO family protein
MAHAPLIPLPAHWHASVKSGLLYALALARRIVLDVRAGFENGPLVRARLAAENDRLKERVAMLEEELRIKDARMARIDPARRPHYPPAERLAILMLRAAAGWNAAETGRRFFVTAATIATWMRRLDEEGPDALVRVPVPVNRFPDFVTTLVHKLRTTIPSFGTRRLAAVLARAGLKLAPTTVRRLADDALAPTPPTEPPSNDPAIAEERKPADAETAPSAGRVVTAREPHRLWHIDITVVSTLGLWIPWLPYALPILWPFSWHVAVVLDHASRAVIARAVYKKEPSGRQICTLLDRARQAAGRAPRYIVTDQGTQFQGAYRRWCARHGVRPRFGAVGKKGSIAVIERFFRSLKGECFRKILVPFSLRAMTEELSAYVLWYNEHRPHEALQGRTPAERLAGASSADATPRLEPRPRYPLADTAEAARASPPVRRTGELEPVVSYLESKKHLPIVALREAA